MLKFFQGIFKNRKSSDQGSPIVAARSGDKRGPKAGLFLQSEQSLRATLLSMGDGVITTDEYGLITFLNPSAQELTGWSLEDAIGKPFLEVFRIYNSLTGAPAQNIVDVVLTTGQKVNLANHTVLHSADGVHRHISDSAAPIRDDEGSLRGIVLIFSDVTERYLLQRQLLLSEAKNAAAVEMAQIGTWEYDVTNDAVTWSPLYRRMLGYPEDYTPTKDSWKELAVPDDVARIAEEQSHPKFDAQYRFYRKSDGALRHIRTYANTVADKNGCVLKVMGVARDITDDLEIGRRIRENEELFRTTFEHAVIGMAHIAVDGKRFLRVNRSLCKTLLYTKEELLATPIQNIVHPGDLQLVQQTMNRIFNERHTTKEEIRRCIRKDGSVVWLALSSSAMYDSAGKPLYLITSLQDVTASHTAQVALKKSEERLLRAQKISNSGNWEIDLVSMQLWASNESFRIYGFPKTENNLLPLAVAQGFVLQQDRAMLDDALDRLLRTDAPYDVEFSISRFDDKRLRMLRSIAVAERDANGRPLRVSGVLQDITEKRRLEEEYGKALSTTPDGFWLCDNETRVKVVNDAICAMLGYSREELIGMRVRDLENNKDPAYMAERRRQVLSQGADRFEAQMRRKDGTVFDAEVSLSYIPGADSTCAFMRDITERKKRENHIHYLSYHDILTGLYNRAYFEMECERLEEIQTLPTAVLMADVNGLKLTNDVFGHQQGDKLLCSIAEILKKCARPDDIVTRIGGDEFCVLMPKAGVAEAKAFCVEVARLCSQSAIRLSDGSVLYPSLAMGYATRFTSRQALQKVFKEAEDAMYKRKLLERKSMHSSLLASIRATMYEKSHETREHTDRLMQMADQIGRELKLDENQISELELLCSLHDLGKIGVPEHILDKPGPLTEAEWEEMRKHSEIGYRIAQASPEIIGISEAILCHHERWDGTGYPQGLKANDIPLLSRILSVVDSFDTMVNGRVYRKAIPTEDVLAEIERCCGTQFDPLICELFLKFMRKTPEGKAPCD